MNNGQENILLIQFYAYLYLYYAFFFGLLPFLLFSDFKSTLSFKPSVVKTMPFLFFKIQGALGLISISLNPIPPIIPIFFLNLISLNLIFGKQKESLKEMLFIFSGGYIEHNLFLTIKGVISSIYVSCNKFYVTD